MGEKGLKDKDENIAAASCQRIGEGVQTCKQKAAVLQGRAPSGQGKALSTAGVESRCPVWLCYLW